MKFPGSDFSSLPSSCDQECLPESRPDERPGIRNAHPGNPWDSISSASSFSSSPLDDWQHASDHINQSAKGSSNIPPSNVSTSAKRTTTTTNGQVKFGSTYCPQTSRGHLSHRATSQVGVDDTTSYECSVAHRQNVYGRPPASCHSNSTNMSSGAGINASFANSNTFPSTSRKISTSEGGMSYPSSFSYGPSRTTSGAIQGSACSSSHTFFTLPTVSAGSNSASSRKSDSDSRPSFDLPGDTVTMAPLETIVAVDKSPPVTHTLTYNKVSSTGAKWIGRKNGPDGHSPDRPALLVSLGGETPEKTKIGHFFAVNTNMKIILDCQNGKGRCISYSSVDLNDAKLVENFFRAFNVISVGKLYGVQVRVDRISQYLPHFISVRS